MRLIDADALLAKYGNSDDTVTISNEGEKKVYAQAVKEFMDYVDNAPTIDTEEQIEEAEGSPKLGMSLWQMEQEVEFMRQWDTYIKDSIGKVQYDLLSHQFCLEHSCEWLERNGVDSQEFRDAMDAKYRTEEQ